MEKIYPESIPTHVISSFKDIDMLNLSASEYIKAYNHIIKNPHDENILAMHTHNFYEINIVVKGEGMHYISENKYPAGVGDIFVIPPNIPHGYFSHGDFHIYHMLISSLFLSGFKKELDNTPGYHYLFSIEPFFRVDSKINMAVKLDSYELSHVVSLMQRLMAYDKTNKDYNLLLKNSLALNIIAELLYKVQTILNTSKRGKTTTKIISIAKAMEYMNKNFDRKISFIEVAKAANMSYSTFLRDFSKHCGMTPSHYLLQYRIEQAMHQLVSTEKTIASIALSCGFYDSSDFIKSFKKEKNISPSKFREEQNKE